MWGGPKRGLAANSLLPGSKSCSEASKEGWSSKRPSSSEMVVMLGEVEVRDGLGWPGMRPDVQQVEVGRGDEGEEDGGAGGDVDCDQGELDFVLDGKEHRRTVMIAGVVMRLLEGVNYIPLPSRCDVDVAE